MCFLLKSVTFPQIKALFIMVGSENDSIPYGAISEPTISKIRGRLHQKW